MSIIKTRSFLERSGCGLVTSIIIGIIFVIGIIAYGGGGRYSGDPNAGAAPVVEIGDLTVTRELFSILTGEEESRAAMNLQEKFGQYAQAVGMVTRTGFGYAAASEMGIRVNDDDVERGIQREMDDIAAQYAPMMGMKTAAEFKKSTQGQRLMEQFTTVYKKMREAEGGDEYLRAQFSVSKMAEALEKDVKVTDDELKHSSDEYTFRTIAVNPVAGKVEEVQKTADAVLAEIKADGFAKVAEKYSKPSAEHPGVIANATGFPMPRQQVEILDGAGELLKLKAGETSGALKTGEGLTVYHLVQIKENPPKDFDKQKAQLRESYVKGKASEAMSKRIEAAEKKTKVVWHDKGLETINLMLKGPRDYKSLMDIVAKADEAEQAPGSNTTATALARYLAVESAWSLANPKQKKDMREIRAEALEGALGLTEDKKVRMDLADLYIELGDVKQALDMLETAADVAEVEADFKEVEARTKKMLALKLVQPKDLAKVEKFAQERKKDLADDAAEKARIDKELAAEDKANAKASGQADKKDESTKESGSDKAPEPKRDESQTGSTKK